MTFRFILLAPLVFAVAACGHPDPADVQGLDVDANLESTGIADPAAPLERSDAVLEQGSLELLEATAASVLAANGAGAAPIPKSCARPIGFNSDVILAETGMGAWHIQDPLCRDQAYCPDGTYAFQISLKSMPNQGSGDDLAVTGFAVGCNNPITGAFISWAVPLASAGAPGDWDASNVCSVGSPLWGGRLRLMGGPTSGSDDWGVTDEAGACADGTAANATPNNPESWGTWQSWKTCPSGKRVCGVLDKTDPDNSSDDAGLTGVMISCCDYS